ncbi:MAG: hypothetical protein OJF55_002553 [Rhodanobacteraceae bacterium]|nr:MAG: hypothetical protein OJF55_002553 [Rhodanobacteraceae bacterium]
MTDRSQIVSFGVRSALVRVGSGCALLKVHAEHDLPYRQVHKLLAKRKFMGYNAYPKTVRLAVRFGVWETGSGLMMRRWLANAVLAGLGLALPSWAFAQATQMPVIPAVPNAHAKKSAASAPVWQKDGNTLSVTADGHAGTAVPAPAEPSVDAQTRSAGAGVRLTTKPGLTAHANVREIHWTPVVAGCAAALPGVPADPTCLNAAADGVQHGEVGAGFAGHGVKLDLSVGQSQSEPVAAPPPRRAALPRVLPAEGGADVAAPLWFRNSTSTSINARGQLDVAPDTSVKLGASVGRVHFLPGSGLAADDTLDQTTLSLGIQHGAVRGSIVGHVLEPNLPGAALDQNQRWSGIDLGISVRLPWRGELNFGAQNVWTSGRAPLLFGPNAGAPDQGRVPYVQYHQDL